MFVTIEAVPGLVSPPTPLVSRIKLALEDLRGHRHGPGHPTFVLRITPMCTHWTIRQDIPLLAEFLRR